MGHIKVFMVCVYRWVILWFISDSPFLLTTFSVYLLLFVEAVKGIKDGKKKTGIPLVSNFILGVYNYSLAGMFS